MSSPVIALVTGANTGIGYETVKKLAESTKTYEIILSGRNIDRVNAAVEQVKAEVPETKSTVHPLQLDITDDASVDAAAKWVADTFGRLDVLVNNAGATFDNDIASGALSVRNAFNKSWDVNVTSTHIWTQYMAPLLIKSPQAGHTPRVIFVTSGTSTLAGSTILEGAVGQRLNGAPPAGWPKEKGRFSFTSYRSSKTGLNMLMREWEKILRNDGVKVFAVAPGFLATGLGGDTEQLRKMGAGEPSEGGVSLRKVIEGERDADAGLVVRNYATPVQDW